MSNRKNTGCINIENTNQIRSSLDNDARQVFARKLLKQLIQNYKNNNNAKIK